jgi:hypothetical protein
MQAPTAAQWWLQLVWLGILAIPVACIAWTITHEEIFREPRERWSERARSARRLLVRKAFYILTCEYCLSHYVALLAVAGTRFRLLIDDWRGYGIAFFSLVAVANVYMSSFARLRQEVKSEGLEARRKEQVLARVEDVEERSETQSAASSSAGSSSPGQERDSRAAARSAL